MSDLPSLPFTEQQLTEAGTALVALARAARLERLRQARARLVRRDEELAIQQEETEATIALLLARCDHVAGELRALGAEWPDDDVPLNVLPSLEGLDVDEAEEATDEGSGAVGAPVEPHQEGGDR